MEKTKICGGKWGCGEEKPISEFQFSNEEKGTYQVQCKSCRNKMRRDKTQERKDKWNKENGITSGVNKKCSKCKEVKPVNEFGKLNKRKDGLKELCKECKRKETKEYRTKNPISEECREISRRKAKERRAKDPEKYRTESRQYFKNNPNYRLDYEQERNKDPIFRIKKNISRRMRYALFSGVKKDSATKNLGCSVPFLKQHLVQQFYSHPKTKKPMTWENYGIKGWHIDHIIPLAFFDLADPEQFKIAVHYKNLQPMWAYQNLQKSSSLPDNLYELMAEIKHTIKDNQ